MKKSTLIALLLFVLTSFTAFSQGEWIEETVDPETGLRTGKIEVNGNIYEIKPNADLEGANLYRANLEGANLTDAIELIDPKDEKIAELEVQLSEANAEINTLQAQIDELLARPTLEQLAAVEAERDARPTKAAYDAVVAERDAKPTLDEIQDGRIGSIVLTPIPNTNTAILNIDIEQSDDLKTWTLYRKILESISMPEGKKFYRFALDK